MEFINEVICWVLGMLGLYWVAEWVVHREEYRKTINNNKDEMDWILNGEGER